MTTPHPIDLPTLARVLRAALINAFGADGEHVRQTLCLAEEAGEFVQAARRYLGLARTPGDLAPVAAELADVVITAYVTAEAFGIDLPAAIAAKAGEIQTRGMRTPRVGDTPDPTAYGPFAVTCPACPDRVWTADTDDDALNIAAVHDDTHHDGDATAAIARLERN